jgi:hypothetical protein
MRKLTILVDMDDVLNNLIERWVEELNILSGTSVAYEDKAGKLEERFIDYERMTYWGCSFFDNQYDAARSFGL